MDDYREIEQDYVRRLKEAQERGDKAPVPLIDSHRVRAVKNFVPVGKVTQEAYKLLTDGFKTKEGLGATEDV